MLAKLFPKKAETLAGLDIGSYAVKGMTLSKSSEQVELVAVSYEKIPANTIAEREIQDIENLSRVVKKSKQALATKQLACAVSGSTVFSKVIQLDKGLTDDEMEQQIEVEADSLIPYPIAEVYVDFEELGDNKTSKSKVDVLLSAARRQSINSRVSAVEGGGMAAEIVDIEAYALGRAAQFLLGKQLDDKVVCCLDIGASQTLMAVILNGDIVFASDQLFGIQQLMQSLASVQNIDVNLAVQQFNDDELPDLFHDQVLLPFLMNMVQQVKRMTQMYMASATHQPIDILYLSGSAMQLPDAMQYMAESFQEEVLQAQLVSSLTPREGIDLTVLKKYEQQMLVAFGLALRGFSSCHR